MRDLFYWCVIGYCVYACQKRPEVERLIHIYSPENLSSDPTCQRFWAEIQAAGLNTDKYAKNWNEIIVERAFSLIEGRCVEPQE